MLYLLNPRVWIALAIVAALAASHITAYRKGKAAVMADWTQAKAEATIEARRVESARQTKVDAALNGAAAREKKLESDAGRARAESRGLRDDIRTARVAAEESRAAALALVDTYGIIFEQCSARYSDMAAEADRAHSEVRTLREAWPK